MTRSDARDIAIKGLWSNNPALVQLLGLCPLLAVTGSVVNGLGLGIATLGVMLGASASASALRHQVRPEVRLPAFVLIIAAFVTCVELAMAALAYELYQVLGIFLPLIVTNCAILARVEAFASRQPLKPALFDALMNGLGFSLVLVLIGGIRELLGQGTLFAGMDLLLGDAAGDWTVHLPGDGGMLFLVLPPGAFLITGLLIAAKNAIDDAVKRRRPAPTRTPRDERRVRVTGVVR
ncbi:electron transport complex subunit RsxE [Halomonas litopenaei]|uniref:Ion-translocating oxidoreductase complex subunit E n=1 Tax=Halomonas litopenaei TaxID=2109328 RepID=A0ABX5ISK1_9GAMM|nr:MULTISPECIES: electron transport complex subunit E [Halomonas]MBY5942217.1 electron transport complex subunit E [Halomonas sp. DP5N14-9]PTL89904.1 electron transport complex subunit RsxE [Halomonas sp. SYSU XM8]PTL92475.1 electron transport complex subunit RsxE [Halomonas litopenaei]